jgi:hypothetical protein
VECPSEDGKLVGENSITQAMNNCVLKESYRTSKGFAGESFNIFDKTTGKWHQTWVDNSGMLLQLDGGLVEQTNNKQAMVLQGKMIDSKGKQQVHRITWQPQVDGSVHQVWDMSEDNGANWKNLFYGIYKKK